MKFNEEWRKLEIEDNITKEFALLEIYLEPEFRVGLEMPVQPATLYPFFLDLQIPFLGFIFKTKKLSFFRIENLGPKRKFRIRENFQLENIPLFNIMPIKFSVRSFDLNVKSKIQIQIQNSFQSVGFQFPIFCFQKQSIFQNLFVPVELLSFSVREPLTSFGSLRLFIGNKYSRLSYNFLILRSNFENPKKEDLRKRKFKVIVNFAMLQHIFFLRNLKLLEIYERDFGENVSFMQLSPNCALKFFFGADKDLLSCNSQFTIIMIKDRIPSKRILENLTMFTAPYYFISNTEEFYIIIEKLANSDKSLHIREFESCHERYLVRTFGITSYQAQSLLQNLTIKEILRKNRSSRIFS